MTTSTRNPNRFLAAALAAVAVGLLGHAAAHASGVGASYFQPATIHASAGHTCPTGACRPGRPCASCNRLGFACNDCATPGPCTPDGGCYPARATYGHYRTNWRRWPGDYDTVSGPTPVDAGDSLLRPFEAPPANEEDQQAPPPIETAPEEDEEAPKATPTPELDLPPARLPDLPRQNPRIDPQPPAQDAAPALPFGARVPSRAPSVSLPPMPRLEPWRDGVPVTPVSAPVGSGPSGGGYSPARAGAADEAGAAGLSPDNPPPLPSGFTHAAPSLRPRRLPTSRMDSAVRAASATAPIAAPRPVR